MAYADYGPKLVSVHCDSPPATTTKGPAVPYAMRQLEEEVACLGASVDALIARLGPAISPRPRAANVCDQPLNGEACALENGIAQVRRSLGVIRERVSDTLDCLEI